MSSRGATETTKKIRAAVEVKLKELGTRHDKELPDYIIMMIANRKTKSEMKKSLKMFIGSKHSEEFTTWLYKVLELLHALSGKSDDSPFAIKPKPDKEEKKENQKHSSSSNSKKKHKKHKSGDAKETGTEKGKRSKENVPEKEHPCSSEPSRLSSQPSTSKNSDIHSDRRVIEVSSEKSSTSEKPLASLSDSKTPSQSKLNPSGIRTSTASSSATSTTSKSSINQTRKPGFRLKIPTRTIQDNDSQTSKRSVKIIPNKSANEENPEFPQKNDENEDKDTLFVDEVAKRDEITKFVITLDGHGEVQRRVSTADEPPKRSSVMIVRPSFMNSPPVRVEDNKLSDKPAPSLPTEVKKPNPFSGFSFKSMPKFTKTVPAAEPPLKVSEEEIQKIVPLPKPESLEPPVPPQWSSKFGSFKFGSFTVTSNSQADQKNTDEKSTSGSIQSQEKDGLTISENIIRRGLFGSKQEGNGEHKTTVNNSESKEPTFSITFGGIKGVNSVERKNLKEVENFDDEEEQEDEHLEEPEDIDGDSDFDEDEKQIFEELMKEDGLIDEEGNPVFISEDNEEEARGEEAQDARVAEAASICDDDVIEANCSDDAVQEAISVEEFGNETVATSSEIPKTPPPEEEITEKLGAESTEITSVKVQSPLSGEVPAAVENAEETQSKENECSTPLAQSVDPPPATENTHPKISPADAETDIAQEKPSAGIVGQCGEGAGELFLDEIDLELEEAAERVMAEQRVRETSPKERTTEDIEEKSTKEEQEQNSSEIQKIAEPIDNETESLMSEPVGPALSIVSATSQKKVMVVLPMPKQVPEELDSEANHPAEPENPDGLDLDLELHSEDEKLIEANMPLHEDVLPKEPHPKKSKADSHRSKKEERLKHSKDKKKKSKRSKHRDEHSDQSKLEEAKRTVRIEGRYFPDNDQAKKSSLHSPGKNTHSKGISEEAHHASSLGKSRHRSHSRKSEPSERKRKINAIEESQPKQHHKKRSRSKSRKRSHSKTSERDRYDSDGNETAEMDPSTSSGLGISPMGPQEQTSGAPDSPHVNPLFLVMEGVGNSLRERILDRMKKKALASVKTSPVDSQSPKNSSDPVPKKKPKTARGSSSSLDENFEFKINTNFGNSPADIALRNSEKIDDILARLGPIQPVSIDLDQESDSGEEEGEIKEPKEVVRKSKSEARLPTASVSDRLATSSNWASGRLEQCRFWPHCRNSSCTFAHPKSGSQPSSSNFQNGPTQVSTTPCRTFPNCRFGDRCRFMHPLCKFDPYCNRTGCRFSHSKPSVPEVMETYQYGGGPSSGMVHPPAPPQFFHPLPVSCPQGRACKTSTCPFSHPPGTTSQVPICRFGSHCALRNCELRHEATPSPHRSRSGSAVSRRSGTPRGYQG